MANLNPIELQKHLKGVEYPASRSDIVKQAETNGADEETLAMLRKLKDSMYDSPAQVNHAASEV